MSRKKRPLADLLWEAANVHLLSSVEGRDDFYGYSCNAVKEAAANDWDVIDRVEEFLISLGVSPNRDDYTFGTRSAGHKRQGVRYMWLLLAMHVAEDEGITV